MLIKNREQFHSLLDDIHRNSFVVVDTESNGLEPFNGSRLIGISLTLHNREGNLYNVYLPFRHGEGDNLSIEWLDELASHWAMPGTTYVFFNAAFDIHILSQDGLPKPEIIEDVMIAAHLLNENEDLSNGFKKQGAYTLKRLSRKYLGEEYGAGEEDLKAKAKARGVDPKAEMWKLPAEDVSYYAEQDTEITWHLREFYRPALEKWGLWEFYRRRNKFLLDTLIRMERNGINIDVDELYRQREQNTPRMEAVESEIAALASEYGMENFNPRSPKQVKKLFRLYGTPVEDTRALTLEARAKAGNELAQLMLDYRTFQKAESTYYRPYSEYMGEDGRIHPSYFVTGTRTGRLSARNPNPQQMPKKSGYGVKEFIVPRPGHVFVEIDFSQLELRLGAHFAEEQLLIEAYQTGADVHQQTADYINEQSGLSLTRQEGKRANFGLLYGMGPKKASRLWGVSYALAEEIHGAWHTLYPSFRAAMTNYSHLAAMWRDAEGNPLSYGEGYQYVRLFNGRKRTFHEYLGYMSEDNNIFPPYKDAWNFVVQGTAAAVMEESLVRISDALPDNRFYKPIATVHDSLVCEIFDSDDCLYWTLCTIKGIMEDWNFSVPIIADIEISRKSWADVEEINVGC